MVSNNIDRMKTSFIELLQQKRYSQISIKDITDHAHISRRTFYQYYENKLQIYEEVAGDFIEWSLRPFEKNDVEQLFGAKIEQFTLTLIKNIDVVESLFNDDCPQIMSLIIAKILSIQIHQEQSGFFLSKLSHPAAQKYYIEIVSQNCCSSIRYVLQNKHLPKEELIQGLCDACNAIAYFYSTNH